MPDFEEADFSSSVGDDDNADDELQDCEDRTGDVEDLNEGDTGYQDRKYKNGGRQLRGSLRN